MIKPLSVHLLFLDEMVFFLSLADDCEAFQGLLSARDNIEELFAQINDPGSCKDLLGVVHCFYLELLSVQVNLHFLVGF